MKKIPETKARMVRWGRMWPMLLSTKPMNMKKRLTRGKGVAERIISERRQDKVIRDWIKNPNFHSIWFKGQVVRLQIATNYIPLCSPLPFQTCRRLWWPSGNVKCKKLSLESVFDLSVLCGCVSKLTPDLKKSKKTDANPFKICKTMFQVIIFNPNYYLSITNQFLFCLT